MNAGIIEFENYEPAKMKTEKNSGIVFSLSLINEAAYLCGIEDSRMAAEILSSLLDLRDNRATLVHVRNVFGEKNCSKSLEGKFNQLIREFIIENYSEEFKKYCDKNNISLFPGELEDFFEDSIYTRILYVLFLRKEIGLRPPFVFVD